MEDIKERVVVEPHGTESERAKNFFFPLTISFSSSSDCHPLPFKAAKRPLKQVGVMNYGLGIEIITLSLLV